MAPSPLRFFNLYTDTHTEVMLGTSSDSRFVRTHGPLKMYRMRFCVFVLSFTLCTLLKVCHIAMFSLCWSVSKEDNLLIYCFMWCQIKAEPDKITENYNTLSKNTNKWNISTKGYSSKKYLCCEWNLKNDIQSLKTDISLSIKNFAIFWQYR